MQLPQSMFGIRSNAVVLLKQQIAYRPGMSFLWGHKWVFHTKSDVLFISSFNGGVFKGPKMLSSFPFTPSKQRHWGYTEHAEDSTHLYQEKGFVDLTFIRSRSPSCLMSSYLLGCVFYTTFVGCLTSRTVVHRLSTAAAVVGASVVTATRTPYSTQLSTNGPKLPQCSTHTIT